MSHTPRTGRASPERARRLPPAVIAAWLAVAPLGATSSAAGQAPERPAHPAAIGASIYRSGSLPTGEQVRATVGADVVLAGRQAACGNCHRRSGLGSSESGIVAPPVTGAALYRPVEGGYRWTGLSRSDGPGLRPAYTDDTLARAIREGVDAGGRALDPLMPRFALDDTAVAALIAYLKSLGHEAPPGVDDAAVHVATVITPGVDAQKRDALLSVLQAFARDIAAETRQETRRRARGGWAKRQDYEGFRSWALHVWQLRGPPNGWQEELEALYRQQPVFALVSGLAAGSWRPVEEFCERRGIPALFPITDLPGAEPGEYYTLYFHRGLPLEADAVAGAISASPPAGPVVQIYRAEFREAASEFSRNLRSRAAITTADIVAGPGAASAEAWTMVAASAPDVAVLWLDRDDLTAPEVAHALAACPRIFVPSAVLDAGLPDPLLPLAGRLHAAYPYVLPGSTDPGRSRTLVWLRARGLQVTDERVQSGAFFAATLFGEAFKELRGRFSRDYLIERIEHMVDNALTSSVYPRLTLGPGERFASTGCYVVRLDPGGHDSVRVVPTTPWRIP